MGRLVVQFGRGQLLAGIRRYARKTGRSEAAVVRMAVELHTYVMKKVAEGKVILVYDPTTGEKTQVDLTDF